MTGRTQQTDDLDHAGSGSPTSVLEEVEYPAGYAAGLAPVQLSFVSALNGDQGTDPASDYCYCELGCGSGRTVLILAAANPQARFHGIDLSEQHIDAARALADRAGLDNVAFHCLDIAEADPVRLPEFDFITMHGVYAWVSDEVRASIVRFIDQKLRPGGLVHLSYNALPGWSAVVPLRRYFLERSERMDGTPIEKVDRILRELEDLRERQAPFFEVNPSAARMLQAIATQDRRYVVHELLSPDWRPLSVREVSETMSAIGLRYVGDSRTLENLFPHNVLPSFADDVAAFTDRIEREVHRDFISNRFFRGDVYFRPGDAADAEPGEAASTLARVRIGMERTPAEGGDEVEVMGGRVRVEGSAVDLLYRILLHENRPLEEVVAHPALASQKPEDVKDAVLLLMTNRSLVPCARPSVDFEEVRSALRPAPTLNRVLLEEPVRDWLVLACPVTGAGLAIHGIEACLLSGLCSPDPLARALEEIERRNIALTEGDRALEGDERREAVGTMLRRFLENKLPLLYSLGVVEPVPAP